MVAAAFAMASPAPTLPPFLVDAVCARFVPFVRQRPAFAMVRRVAVARPDLDAERALCERAHAGDRAALGQVLRRHGPMIYRAVLLPRLGSEALAQDALAET